MKAELTRSDKEKAEIPSRKRGETPHPRDELALVEYEQEDVDVVA